MLRRRFLLGSVCASAFPSPATTMANKTAGTVFNIRWRDLNIGYSKVNLKKNKSAIIATIEVFINVKLLGIQFFSYKLNCKEIWQNKIIQSISSKTTANKKQDFVTGEKKDNRFEIKGSAFSGHISLNPATTSYFTPDFLKRNVWISTQNGTPLEVKAKEIQTLNVMSERELIPATKWEVTGDLKLSLYYDEIGNWVSSSFFAGGSEAKFVLSQRSGSLHEVWNLQ